MKRALLVAIALVALAWAVPLHPSTALADAGVEVTEPEVTREGDIVGPTVDVTATADEFLEVTVMVSDIDLFFNLHGLVVPPNPSIEIKVCMVIEVCTDS